MSGRVRVLRPPGLGGTDRTTLWVVGAGLVSLALYRALAGLGDLRVHLTAYLVLHGALFAVYAAAGAVLVRRLGGASWRTRGRGAAVWEVVSRRGAASPAAHGKGDEPTTPTSSSAVWILIAVFAVAFRLTLLFVPASLSSDILKYDREGSVLAQVVFGAMSSAGFGEIGDKAVFLVFDLAVACALTVLLRRLGQPAAFAMLYAWNPLVVVEVASNGRIDPVGLFFLVLAAIFITAERRFLATASYGVSVLARVVGLGLAPIVVRRFKTAHLLVGAGVIVAGYAAITGGRPVPIRSLKARIERPGYNAIVAPAVQASLEAVLPGSATGDLSGSAPSVLPGSATSDAAEHPAPFEASQDGALAWWTRPLVLTRLLLVVAMVAGMIVISLDVLEIERELLLALGLLIALSPIVHPSLLLWVLPFAAAELSWPWLLFTGLVPLSYLSLRAPDGQVPWNALLVEWGAPAVLAIALAAWKRWPSLRAQGHAERA